jgi:hypothetical protein
MVQRALGLRTPKALGRHLDRAEAVFFDPFVHYAILLFLQVRAKEFTPTPVNYA